MCIRTAFNEKLFQITTLHLRMSKLGNMFAIIAAIVYSIFTLEKLIVIASL